MTQEQRNNPLHGITLERLVTELADHYGFEILAEHININCFKSHPSIKSSLKFLRKTEWARQKVEAFYLYKYKSLPKADDFEYELPPRERTIPEGLVQRPPKKLQKASAEPKGDDFAEPTYVKKDSLEEHFANEHSSEKYQSRESVKDRVTAEPASSTDEAPKPTSGKFNPWAKSSKIEK